GTGGEGTGGAGDLDAVADLDTGGHLLPLNGGGPGLAQRRIDEVLKLDGAALEAGRVQVGQVVGRIVEHELLGGHAGGGAVKSTKHTESFAESIMPDDAHACLGRVFWPIASVTACMTLPAAS